jgi:thioesterase domain-containing protein
MTRHALPAPLQAHYIGELDRRAVGSYQPKTYLGPIIHVKAHASHADLQVVRKLTAGELQAHEIPCSHADLLTESYIRMWAKILRRCLQEAQVKATTRNRESPLENDYHGIVTATTERHLIASR